MSFISSWGIESRYCCVVSEAGEYLTLVLVQKIADPSTGEKTDQIQNYKLKDGELCRMFTAAEIGAVGQASIAHKLYHTTYCNHLFAWIRRATASELAGITYGAELPEDLAASMQALLTQAGSTTGEV